MSRHLIDWSWFSTPEALTLGIWLVGACLAVGTLIELGRTMVRVGRVLVREPAPTSHGNRGGRPGLDRAIGQRRRRGVRTPR